MKFNLEKSLGVSVQSCQPDQITLQMLSQGGDAPVQETRVCTKSVVLCPTGEVIDWDLNHFDALTESHFGLVWQHQPELVIFGTGQSQHFPAARLLEPFARSAIGIEVMDTTAACRTYNIVQSEGRKAMALLIIES
ncbi:MAG: MTH938/NDUFAF3 family protein [Gammaproteobacteria bacterium]|nr:MTH938/NDUFAF3 family protein [Gammaproteobacteria bacterium]